MGSKPMAASIKRVSITGLAESYRPYGWYGLYNVLNCVALVSELPTPYAANNPDVCNGGLSNGDPAIYAKCFYPLTGKFDVESSSFQTCGSGIFFGRVVGSKITVHGNTVTDTVYGLDLENIETSIVDVAQNSISKAGGANLVAYNPYFPGQAASLYAIHNNSLDVGGPGLSGADGMFLYDNEVSDNGSSLKVIDAAIVNNNIRGEDCRYGLIHLIFTEGTLVAANEFSGSSVPNFDWYPDSDPFGYGSSSNPFGAILSQGASKCSIPGNNVANLAVAPDPAGAAIFLGAAFPSNGPAVNTSGCIVAGPCRPSDVKDFGSSDKILCFPLVSPLASHIQRGRSWRRGRPLGRLAPVRRARRTVPSSGSRDRWRVPWRMRVARRWPA